MACRRTVQAVSAELGSPGRAVGQDSVLRPEAGCGHRMPGAVHDAREAATGLPLLAVAGEPAVATYRRQRQALYARERG